MWWERFGVAPVRPEAAEAGWHSVELTLKSFNNLEKAVKSAVAAGAVGWWLSPWTLTAKGNRATLTVFFAKRRPAREFEADPPVSQRR